MADVRLTPAQLAAVTHRGSALLIAAAAGSGKTKVLVERLMDRITGPDCPDIDEFLIITFTRAAASELRSRISGELTARLAQSPGDRRLRRQLSLACGARICTIDSFCSSLVRENAHVLGVRPDFRIPDEREQEVLYAEVLTDLLEGLYDQMTPEFVRLADTLGAGRDDAALVKTLRETYAAVLAHPYPRKWLHAQLDRPEYPGDAGETVWGEYLLGRSLAIVRSHLRSMEAALHSLSLVAQADAAYGASYEGTLEGLESFAGALEKGWDAACAYVLSTGGRGGDFPRCKSLKAEYKELPEVSFAARAREGCKAAVAGLAELFSDDSAGILEDMAAVRPVTDELLRLVLSFDSALEAEKKRRGLLDYSDLEHLALRLLLDDGGQPTERARDVSSRFCEILVDEYQDVSGVQDMIFQAVSRGGKNLVLVGDVKQSIYRFRLADPTIFLQKYNAWADAPGPGLPRRLLLSQNFRSRAGVLDAVNDLFSDIMSTELGEMEYGDDEALRAGGSFSDSSEPPFELCVADMPNAPDGMARIDCEAAYAAARVKELMDSGMTVDGEPLAPRHVAVLMRSPSGRAASFISAFRRAGIPARSQKSDDAGGDADVAAALALLTVIDNPRQDVPLIAVMRSPAFGFSADELALIRSAAPRSDFYTALETAAASGDEKCAGFLSVIESFRRAAPSMSLERLLRLVYDSTGMLAIASAHGSPGGGRLYALLEAARSFGETGGSLFDFTRSLRELKESGKPFVLPDSRASGGEVTVCSIHASKGLEWPVVIVANLSGQFNTEDGKKALLIHRDLGVGASRTDETRRISYPTLAKLAIRERIRNETLSEEMRLLYVAMTRARDKLILITAPRSGGEAFASLPAGGDRPEPSELASCSCMADWILLCAARRAPTDVKWQPRIWTPVPGPLSAAAPGTAPTGDPVAVERIKEALEFVPGNELSASLPSKLTATELKGGSLEAEAAEDAEAYVRQDAPSLRRPAFAAEKDGLSPAERGTALHKAVQYAELSNCALPGGAERELERIKAMRLISPAEAQAVSPSRITALAASPLGRRILSSPKVRREFKFSLLMPAGELISGAGDEKLLLQGVVDCFFEEDGALVVVDFKSDFVTPMTQKAKADSYAPQLRAYAKALERITGLQVREKVIYFFRTGKTVTIE